MDDLRGQLANGFQRSHHGRAERRRRGVDGSRCLVSPPRALADLPCPCGKREHPAADRPEPAVDLLGPWRAPGEVLLEQPESVDAVSEREGLRDPRDPRLAAQAIADGEPRPQPRSRVRVHVEDAIAAHAVDVVRVRPVRRLARLDRHAVERTDDLLGGARERGLRRGRLGPNGETGGEAAQRLAGLAKATGIPR